MSIPHEYIEEVVRRNDIVDVVGSYVEKVGCTVACARSIMKRRPLSTSTRTPRAFIALAAVRAAT